MQRMCTKTPAVKGEEHPLRAFSTAPSELLVHAFSVETSTHERRETMNIAHLPPAQQGQPRSARNARQNESSLSQMVETETI